MIIDNEIVISISNRNRKYYKDLGYETDMESILVSIHHLPKMSNFKIKVSCDICDKILLVPYYNYNKYIENGNIYTCHKCCSNSKTKITNIERYGVTSPLKNILIKEKVKNTNIEKYGYICSLQCDEIKEKTKNTNLERYKVENSLSSDFVKNKRKNTNLERYKVENIFQSYEFKIKMNELRIKNGIIIPDDLLKEWHKYKLEIRRLTRESKKKLFSEWDGYDYYDGEYIRENLKLHHNDKRYPTIDHKISIFYGFKNNIPACEIGDIKNLEITKRHINSSKNLNCE